ncbi:hypothetical protein B0H19DRAFT_1081405 [Mycena capillaripes]|nr:hypothetical protein B0H19DRAFT_1081151 [Mycena capillaripes]KAJ6533250.1 hypothetical protein B0H19DRAFT_1081405 [Mycena capillaripes]
MPWVPQGTFHQHRGSGGMFATSQPNSGPSQTELDNDGDIPSVKQQTSKTQKTTIFQRQASFAKQARPFTGHLSRVKPTLGKGMSNGIRADGRAYLCHATRRSLMGAERADSLKMDIARKGLNDKIRSKNTGWPTWLWLDLDRKQQCVRRARDLGRQAACLESIHVLKVEYGLEGLETFEGTRQWLALETLRLLRLQVGRPRCKLEHKGRLWKGSGGGRREETDEPCQKSLAICHLSTRCDQISSKLKFHVAAIKTSGVSKT